MSAAEKGVFWAIVIVGFAAWFRYWWIIRTDKRLRLEERERLSLPGDAEIDFLKELRPIGPLPRLNDDIVVRRGAGVGGSNREGIAGTKLSGTLDRRGRPAAVNLPRARSARSTYPGDQEAA